MPAVAPSLSSDKRAIRRAFEQALEGVDAEGIATQTLNRLTEGFDRETVTEEKLEEKLEEFNVQVEEVLIQTLLRAVRDQAVALRMRYAQVDRLVVYIDSQERTTLAQVRPTVEMLHNAV